MEKKDEIQEVNLVNPVEFANNDQGVLYNKIINAAIEEATEKAEEAMSMKTKLVSPVSFNDKKKDFEEKVYLVLLYTESDDGDDVKEFEICVGRTNCYHYLKEVIEDAAVNGYAIRLKKSLVITEIMANDIDSGDKKYFLLPVNAAMSVYDFCKKMEPIYRDDGFDISGYMDSFDDPDESADYPVVDGHINASAILMKEAMVAEYGTVDFTNDGNPDK